MTIRLRFAPSPTGYLHVGGARSALYNWLFAKSQGGTFILRSDDTDAERNKDEYRHDIVESLRWLGINWEEGVEVGGPHGSYRQSDRGDRYREVVATLIASGAAYYSFETAEILEEFSREARSRGFAPAYDGRYRVDSREAAERIAAGESAPVRFSVPRPGVTTFQDSIRGNLEFDHSQIDDFVILRSDGTPTYHLANTVDDIDYAITHVVRGEDLLSSTPKHILLAQTIGATVPVYAHLSLLLGPDGSKLSKRHGDTAVQAFRDAGYLPEALRNYIAILGWSVGKDEEIIPVNEMVQRFDLSSLSRNPAVFDTVKLEWMSGLYMRVLDSKQFVQRSLIWIEEDLGRALDESELEIYRTIAPLVQERSKVFANVPSQVRFLFVEVDWDRAAWQKIMSKEGVAMVLESALRGLTGLELWTAKRIEALCRSTVAELGLSAKKVFQPLRVAVTGSSVSPPLFESIEALGRERSLDRLKGALDKLVVGDPD